MNTEKIIADCAQFFANCADDGDYICDAISEFCDGETPIYNGQLMDFVRDDPQSLADVVEEGLYNPADKYDFFRHAACAYYFACERQVYDNLDEICARAVMYGHDVSDEIKNAVFDAMENVDNNLTFEELYDIAKNAIAQYWQEKAES